MTSTAALILKLLILVNGTICPGRQAGGNSTGVCSWREENVTISECRQMLHLWYRRRLFNFCRVTLNHNVDDRGSVWTRFVLEGTVNQMFGIKATDGQWFFMQPVRNDLRLIRDDYPNNVSLSDNRVFIIRYATSRDILIHHRNTDTYLSHRSNEITSQARLVERKSLATPMCFRLPPNRIV